MKKNMTKIIITVLVLVVALSSAVMFTACGEIEHGYLPSVPLTFDIDTVNTKLKTVCFKIDIAAFVLFPDHIEMSLNDYGFG